MKTIANVSKRDTILLSKFKRKDMSKTSAGRKSGEALVAAAFLARSIPMITYDDYLYQHSNPRLLAEVNSVFVVRNHPFTSFYGTRGFVEFMVYEKGKASLAIEVKHQNTSGSVDEKLPYVILNAMHHWGAEKGLIILSGDHWASSDRGKAIIEKIRNWANDQAKDKVMIQDISQFNNWLAKTY